MCLLILGVYDIWRKFLSWREEIKNKNLWGYMKEENILEWYL